jgi:hypothetical protein
MRKQEAASWQDGQAEAGECVISIVEVVHLQRAPWPPVWSRHRALCYPWSCVSGFWWEEGEKKGGTSLKQKEKRIIKCLTLKWRVENMLRLICKLELALGWVANGMHMHSTQSDSSVCDCSDRNCRGSDCKKKLINSKVVGVITHWYIARKQNLLFFLISLRTIILVKN